MGKQNSPQADWVRDALERYEGPLIRYAVRITEDTERARDVVQDTFMKLCVADRVQLNGHLAPWLYRVCRNRALDVQKKEQRMHPMDHETMAQQADESPSPRAAAASSEVERSILDAVNALNSEQQEVFRLKFQDQLSYKEISEVTGFPVNNVRYLIHTSLKALRISLHGQFETADGIGA